MTEQLKAIDLEFRSVNQTLVRLQVVAQHGDWAVCEAPFINEVACCIVYVPQKKPMLHAGGYTFINGKECCEAMCKVFAKYMVEPPVLPSILGEAMHAAFEHDLTKKGG